MQAQVLLADALRQSLPTGQGSGIAHELTEWQSDQRPAAFVNPSELQRPAVGPFQTAVGFISPVQRLLQFGADLQFICRLRIAA